MLEIFLTGLTLASMYALVSAGLALIFGILEVVNFAHGELFMLGGFALYVARTQLHLSYGWSLLLSVGIMSAFGLLMHVSVMRPVVNRSWQVGLMATLALSIFLSNGAILIWGTVPKQVPTPLSSSVLTVFGAALSYQRIIILVSTALVFAGLFVMVRHTRIGKAMRAASQNKEACVVYGIDLNTVTAVTLVLGAGLAGLAGGLIAPVYNVSPLMGGLVTLKAFAIVIMGGFGNVEGALIASVVIGLVEAFGAAYISTAFKDSFAYLAMILVLLLKPEGLFGRRPAA